MNPFLIAGGVSLLGGLLSNRSQDRAAQRAAAEQRARTRSIDQAAAPFASRGPNGQLLQGVTSSPWMSNLQNLFQLTGQTQPGAFTTTPITANTVNPTMIDTQGFDPRQGGGTALPSWMGRAYMNDPTMGDRYMDFDRLINPSGVGAMGNSSQDALMQLIRGEGSASAGGAGVDAITGQVSGVARSNLEQLTQDGSRFDLDGMFGALEDVETRNRDRTVAELQGSAGSIGQRFGTVLNAQEGRMRGEMEEQANLRRQELARQSFESAQNRRLQGAAGLTAQDQILNQVMMANQGTLADVSIANAGNATQASIANANNRTGAASSLASLQASLAGTQASANNSYNSAIANLLQSGMDNQGRLALGNQTSANQTMLAQNSFNQGNAQISQADMALLAQLMGQNAGAANNMAQFNEGNRLNTEQFNTGTAQSSFNTQQQAQQWQQSFLQSLIGQGLGQENMADQRALQALGIRAGMPVPGANPNAGGMGQSIGDMGNLMFMMQMLNRPTGGGTPQGRPATTASYNPGAISFTPPQMPNYANFFPRP